MKISGIDMLQTLVAAKAEGTGPDRTRKGG
jgi:hypothetical protein